MIQNLIKQINILLRDEFDGRDLDPGNSVLLDLSGPGDVSVKPVIASSLGKVEISNVAGDTISSEPRPREYKQEISVNNMTPLGPYPLSRSPLKGTALCKIVFDLGTTDERSTLLIEDKDYTIDYPAKTLLFTTDISAADQIILTYSFIGVFTVKEFEQEFTLTVVTSQRPVLELWSSLVSSAILASHDELLTTYNQTDKTEYIKSNFYSGHSLSELRLKDIEFQNWAARLSAMLTFQVKGNFTFAKVFPSSFGLIEKVRSPGKNSGEIIDIEVGLG